MLRVGGTTESEIGHRKQVLDHAASAARAAAVDGIVAGGGVALLDCVSDLERLTAPSLDETAGIEVVRRALEAPLRRIADNAGTDGATAVARVLQHDAPDRGLDVRRGCYTDMMESGVIDSMHVVRTALANAASAGRLVIGTEAAVAGRGPRATPRGR